MASLRQGIVAGLRQGIVAGLRQGIVAGLRQMKVASLRLGIVAGLRQSIATGLRQRKVTPNKCKHKSLLICTGTPSTTTPVENIPRKRQVTSGVVLLFCCFSTS